MSNEQTKQITREEWRDLGFYYDQDETKWIFVGSKSGLLKFNTILEEYAQNPKNDSVSEHDHFGPYWYLKITTWNKPVITKDAIYGKLNDFLFLATLIKEKIELGKSPFVIDREFSEENEMILYFEVREEEFDPASSDLLIN